MKGGVGSTGGAARAFPAFAWIATAYIAEGIPFAMVIWVAGTMLKDLGHSDAEITVAVASVGVVWSLKPLWAGFLDLFRTKKFFVLASEATMALLFAASAGALFLDAYFSPVIALLWFIAFASATQDICVDGVYISALSEKEQASFIGLQGMAWNLGRIIAVSAAVWLAGYLQTHEGFGVRASWAIVQLSIGGLFATLCAFHWVVLPDGGPPRPSGQRRLRETLGQFVASAWDFCDRPALWGMLSFVLFFRSAEGLLLVEAPLFMQGCVEDGGLQLSLQDKGIIDGTIGTVAVILGGLLGGVFIARYTLRRTLFVLALCVNIPNLCFLYLALTDSATQPLAFSTIAAVVGFEKFWYGFGFVGNMLYMMQQLAPGKYKMTHYAFATALMNLVLVPTQMVSGPLADSLGFSTYFAVVMIATVPSLLAAWFAPFPHGQRRQNIDATSDIDSSEPEKMVTVDRAKAKEATAFALVALAVFLYVDTLCLGWLNGVSSGLTRVTLLSVIVLSCGLKVALAVRSVRAAVAARRWAHRVPPPTPHHRNSWGALLTSTAMMVVAIGLGGWAIQGLITANWKCVRGGSNVGCAIQTTPKVASDNACSTAVRRPM